MKHELNWNGLNVLSKFFALSPLEKRVDMNKKRSMFIIEYPKLNPEM